MIRRWVSLPLRLQTGGHTRGHQAASHAGHAAAFVCDALSAIGLRPPHRPRGRGHHDDLHARLEGRWGGGWRPEPAAVVRFNGEATERTIMGTCSWPGLPVHIRARQLTLAGSARAASVRFLARPRTGTDGQFLSLAAGSFPEVNSNFS